VSPNNEFLSTRSPTLRTPYPIHLKDSGAQILFPPEGFRHRASRNWGRKESPESFPAGLKEESFREITQEGGRNVGLAIRPGWWM
jgi:hypothetical protein